MSSSIHHLALGVRIYLTKLFSPLPTKASQLPVGDVLDAGQNPVEIGAKMGSNGQYFMCPPRP